MNETFRKGAQKVSEATGTSGAFVIAVSTLLIWLVTGPFFDYSDTWQLVINTGTTIVTFLMVFLIQNTQNRDAKAVHLKLDELLRSVEGARDRLMDLQNLTDDELNELQVQFDRIRVRSAAGASDAEVQRQVDADEVTRGKTDRLQGPKS